MRDAQKSYDKISGASTDVGDIDIDLEHHQNDRLIKQKLQLEGVRDQAYEMEDLAVGMKTNLKGQSEQMEKIRGDLRGIRNDVGLSGKLLNAIEVQRRKNKYVLWAIYALLFSLVLFILWWNFGWLIPTGSNEPEVK